MLIPARTIKIIKLGTLALALILLVHLAFQVAAFIHLFFDHAGIALTQEQVAQAHHGANADLRRPVIPRVIHQIFHDWTDPINEALPSDWNANRQTCIDFNKEWENWLWTEKTSRDFISKEYSWFLRTYDNFEFPIQKIDALRYFILRHYGGIYIDLDNGCTASLEPLRFYPTWVTDGGHGALSNNILGAEPNHPYWILMTDSIISYAWNYPLPYITISYVTGQWFETEIWEKYHNQQSKDIPGLVRIMMDMRPGAAPWVFFTQTRGGTWDNWDNQLFKWVGENLVLVFLVIVGLVVSVAAYCCYRLTSRKRFSEI